MATMKMELDSNTVIEIEVDDSLADQMRHVGLREELHVAAIETFQKGISAASRVAHMVQEQLTIDGLSYKEAELHFGITFTGGADVKVVKGEGSGTLNLVVRWSPKE